MVIKIPNLRLAKKYYSVSIAFIISIRIELNTESRSFHSIDCAYSHWIEHWIQHHKDWACVPLLFIKHVIEVGVIVELTVMHKNSDSHDSSSHGVLML